MEYYSYIDQHTATDFLETVAELLDQYPAGLSEYELMQHLRETRYLQFLGEVPALPQALFCAHFFLYQALYRIRDEVRQNQRADVVIEALKIAWLPYQSTSQSASQALDKPDPMREYYLDISNLITTTARDVEELISSFWTRLQKNDQRADALAALGLDDPVDDKTIKMTYRRLVMKYHPDRGGDAEQLHIVNAAVEKLLKSPLKNL